MYQVTWKISDKITVTGTGNTMAEAHEHASSMAEVYGAVTKCGHCGKDWLRPIMRLNKDEDKYYEVWCTNKDCRAKFVFGQAKKPEGSLFPQWKFPKKHPKEGERKPFAGWDKFERKKEENESTF